jgi:hypothetical protein
MVRVRLSRYIHRWVEISSEGKVHLHGREVHNSARAR